MLFVYFNPRPPEEVDVKIVSSLPAGSNISIHDLPRRSTVRDAEEPVKVVNFNPRPPEEVDVTRAATRPEQYNFNPRPPEEVDIDTANFNPARICISIHDLPRRSTWNGYVS